MARRKKKAQPVLHQNGLAPLFTRLRDEVNKEHVGREDAVEAALLALLSGEHCVFLGEPGIAKSSVIKRVLARIDGARVFYKLLFGDTRASSILGQFSLRALELEDKHRRNVEGFLPGVEFAVLEEIFRAPGAVLDALNDIINERVYGNGAEMIPVPLMTLFAASNDIPLNPSLRALWDRFLLRVPVEPLRSKGDAKKLLRLKDPEPDPDKIISLDDLRLAQDEVRMVSISNHIVDGLVEVFLNLKGANPPIEVSDRRKRLSLNVLRAAAWLRGGSSVAKRDFYSLRFTLWTQREEISPVSELLAAYQQAAMENIDAILKPIRELHTQFEKIRAQLQASTGDTNVDFGEVGLNQTLIAASEKAKAAAKELKALRGRVEPGSADEAAIDQAEKELADMTRVWKEVVF